MSSSDSSQRLIFEILEGRLKDLNLRVESLMMDRKNAVSVQELSKHISETFQALMKFCSENPSAIFEHNANWMESIEQNQAEFDIRVQQWLLAVLKAAADQFSQLEKSTQSSHPSSASSRSSYRRAEAKVKAKLARLELEKIKRKHELQNRINQIHQSIEMLDSEHKVQTADAEEEFWEQSTSSDRMNVDVTDNRFSKDVRHVGSEKANKRVLEVGKVANKITCESLHHVQSTPVYAQSKFGCAVGEIDAGTLAMAVEDYPVNTESKSELDDKPSAGVNGPVVPHVLDWPVPSKFEDGKQDNRIPAMYIPNQSVVTNNPDQASVNKTCQLASGRPPDSSQSLSNDVMTLIKHLNRPKPEVLYFSGDSMNYHMFRRNFAAQIDENVDSYAARLSYLLQHCTGEARKLIQSCAKLDPEEGYQKAIKLLEKNYGRTHEVVHSCVKKVVDGPQIKFNDHEKLKEFVRTLEDCKLTLKGINKENEMDNLQILARASNRLFPSMRMAWKRRVGKIIARDEEPSFQDFIEFVTEEETAVHSSFSQMMDDYVSVVEKPMKTSRIRTMAHNVTETVSEKKMQLSSSGEHTRTKCMYCSMPHDLSKCEKFKKKPIVERIKFMRARRLCYICLKYGHVASMCRSKLSCGVDGCTAKHNRLIHHSFQGNNEPDQEQSTNGEKENISSASMPESSLCQATESNRSVYFCIVPVKVSGNDREVETYAFLDVGSAITLCSDKLIDMLGLHREPANISLTTVNGESKIHGGSKVQLRVESCDGKEVMDLPEVFSIDKLPVKANAPLSMNDKNRMAHLRGLNLSNIDNAEVLLMIGVNVPEAFCVQEVRRGRPRQPIAWKTQFGWTLIGPKIERSELLSFNVNFIKNDQNDLLQMQLERMWKTDFIDSQKMSDTAMSREDRYALNLMHEAIKFENGHYQLPLLWRPHARTLPNNLDLAMSRLSSLKRKLVRDDDLRLKYVEIVQDYIAKGYAEKVTKCNLKKCNQIWYIPHFCVVHPQKLKPRVVFDGACQYRGYSLNESLLSGPDLASSLTGVLMRFRQERIALVADIEAMFHQIHVDPKDRDALRFLWWPGGDMSKEPIDHRMTVHLFGSKSSPTVANFCLKRVAQDFGGEFDTDVIEAIEQDFYVDDLLKSVCSENDGLRMKQQLTEILKKGGFKLTKWLSNSEKILNSIPEDEKARSILNLKFDETLSDRVLGVYWKVSFDSFGFNIDMTSPDVMTKRTTLSLVSSLYDPLGFVAVVVIVAKIMQQDLCRKRLGWDEPIPDCDVAKWTKWLEQLSALKDITINRCVKPNGFGRVVVMQIHHFADASSVAYGAVAYLRLVNENQDIHCAFLFGKARVTPLKAISIPRLELTAAVLSVKIDQMLRSELHLGNECESFFWTDSTAVLQSIRNCNKRFPVFVANRLAKIDGGSEVSQWRYVATKQNPADEASRGIGVKKMATKSRWLSGPEFLWKDAEQWPQPVSLPPLPNEFQLVKQLQEPVCMLTDQSATNRLVEQFSDLHSLKKATAWILRFISFLRSKKSGENLHKGPLYADELRRSEFALIKYVQRQSFGEIIDKLSKSSDGCIDAGKRLSSRNILRKLTQMLVNGILRAGGRIEKAPVEFDVKHPIILPYDHHFTNLVILQHHKEVGHSGMGHTWTSLRQKYWIIKGGVAVRKVLGNCISCRKRNAPLGQQIMADLPDARLAVNKPVFSEVGCDFFGPFLVKQGRSNVKRYGCIFTCMCTRAVHIEVAYSLSTDSFINVLRKFIGRRSKPRAIYSDNAGNFQATNKVLRDEIKKWNQHYINDFLSQRNIEWNWNCPTDSKAGGCWERLIRSIRKILGGLLNDQILTDEKLHVLFVEVESILNSRPLCPVTFDVNDEEPLTPNHLLLLRGSRNESPGVFTEKDCYRFECKQVQYMADQFWRRFNKEYLPTLIGRQKWTVQKPNLKIGDIVMISEDAPRCQWLMGRVVEVFPDKNETVRQVKVKTKNGFLKRPINKLCFIIHSDA
ncbi:uncharacterized protein LOC120332657 [Styela clava]